MSTTVRIRDEDKAKLDRIQAKITLEQGEKPSLEEVLHRLLELGERREGEIVRPVGAPVLTGEEKQEVLGSTFDLGFMTREEDIDRELYGGSGGPV